MRTVNLFILSLSLVGLCFLIVIAPELFDTGGLLHRAAIHAGTIAFSITAFVSGAHLIRD